jgi:hypothetical protein
MDSTNRLAIIGSITKIRFPTDAEKNPIRPRTDTDKHGSNTVRLRVYPWFSLLFYPAEVFTTDVRRALPLARPRNATSRAIIPMTDT